MNQKPSVGRIVHFYENYYYGNQSVPDPSAALIVRRIDDAGKCRLCVFGDTSYHFVDADYSEEPKPGFWSWPPRI